MPSGVYKRTGVSEEHKRNIGIGLQRAYDSGKRIPHVPWNKGKKGVYSKETLYKMSQAAIGKIVSQETREKFRQNNLGEKSRKWKGGISLDEKVYKKMCVAKRKELLKKISPIEIANVQFIYEENIKKFGTLSCEYCRKNVAFGGDSLDHKVPLVRGGNHEPDNLQVLCRSCNSKKHSKTDEEYRKLLWQK